MDYLLKTVLSSITIIEEASQLLDFHALRYYSLNYYFNNISLKSNDGSVCYCEFNLLDRTIKKTQTFDHKNLWKT